MRTGNILLDNHKKEMKFTKQFEKIFNVKFRQFFDLVTGFDVCAFDDHLKVPDGTSLKDHIAETYSPEASQLIEDIILQ